MWDVDPYGESVLNAAGIQTIKKLQGVPVVWGARVPAVNSVYTHSTVRRTQSHYVRLFLEGRQILETLFRPNQPNLAQHIILILRNFASEEYRKGVYNNYLSFDESIQIVAQNPNNSSNNQGQNAARDVAVSIINGKLHIFYSYVPAGYLERLYINVGPDILVATYGQTVSV
jgi:phage tail sheath protein FI